MGVERKIERETRERKCRNHPCRLSWAYRSIDHMIYTSVKLKGMCHEIENG
jgi:hypothetical protein